MRFNGRKRLANLYVTCGNTPFNFLLFPNFSAQLTSSIPTFFGGLQRLHAASSGACLWRLLSKACFECFGAAATIFCWRSATVLLRIAKARTLCSARRGIILMVSAVLYKTFSAVVTRGEAHRRSLGKLYTTTRSLENVQ